MCGISGIISNKSTSLQQAIVVNKMNTELAHRGPDGHGIWQNNMHSLTIGHRRLSIIDLTEKASQPMLSLDGRYCIVFNGEIYNYIELKELCLKNNSKFSSNSDTEVILECFRHWGVKAFDMMNGMWALAIYDIVSDTIILSRDRFGIKPLFYAQKGNDFFFASEIKAFHSIDNYFKEIDEISVTIFLEQGYLDREDWTFFKNIKRFPHASYSMIKGISTINKPIKLKIEKFWSPKFECSTEKFSVLVEKIRHNLVESVKLHLVGDVKLGACLSGGIDSSAILAISKSILGCDGDFSAFTTYYPQYLDIDESAWAKKIVDKTNINHYLIRPTYEDFINELDVLIRAQDEPFSTASIFAQYSIYKAIGRTNIKVVLNGQGADEMFGGYVFLIEHFLNKTLYKKSYLNFLFESIMFNKNYSHMNLTVCKIISRMVKGVRISQNMSSNGDVQIFKDTYEERMQKLLNAPSADDLDRYLSFLLCESNIPQLLRYDDRNSMAFSLESRVPFLEKGLVETALSVPCYLKFRNGKTKLILREALRGLLPSELLNRVDKLGFPAPEVAWLKHGFGINAAGNGSREWRELIIGRWRKIMSI